MKRPCRRVLWIAALILFQAACGSEPTPVQKATLTSAPTIAITATVSPAQPAATIKPTTTPTSMPSPTNTRAAPSSTLPTLAPGQKRLDPVMAPDPAFGGNAAAAVEIVEASGKRMLLQALAKDSQGNAQYRRVSSAAWSKDGATVLVDYMLVSGEVRPVAVAPVWADTLNVYSILLNAANGEENESLGRAGTYSKKESRSARSDSLWSPDGKRIAELVTDSASGCPVTRMTGAAPAQDRKLPACDASDHPRYWSVDGLWVVVWSVKDLRLYAYEVDGFRRAPLEQLGKIQLLDERYSPWRVVDAPVCRGASFWECE